MQFQTTALTNAIVESSDASFLVDTIVPGAPLVISFGFVSWEKRPDFDFYGRLKKLEATTDTAINKILVRDCLNAWYHREIPGLGYHVDEVAKSLQQMITTIKPSQVITIGQSMGGYAAIMFGTLLNADTIISFGPLSFLNSKEALLYHDRRWLTVMQALEEFPPPNGYYDLPALISKTGNKPQLHVFFGTKPDEGATESVNLDVFHAHRYAALPNCHIHPFPGSGHAVVQHLIDTKRINGILGQHILGVEIPDEIEPISDSWLSWMVENHKRGIPGSEIIAILIQHGYTESQGIEALASLNIQQTTL